VEFIKGTATAFNLDSTGKTITSVSYRDADGQTVNIDSALVLGEPFAFAEVSSSSDRV